MQTPQQMSTNRDRTIVLPVHCENDECGMASAYQFWPDGSYKVIMSACWHPKRFPGRAKIEQAMAREVQQ